MMMMPTATIPKKRPNNFGLTTCFSMTIDGKDNAVTPIMKESTVPNPTPFATSASEMGSVPKISAYIGTPTNVATNTEYHLS